MSLMYAARAKNIKNSTVINFDVVGESGINQVRWIHPEVVCPSRTFIPGHARTPSCCRMPTELSTSFLSSLRSRTPLPSGRSYAFDRAFGPYSTQQDMYESARPLVESVIRGYVVFSQGNPELDRSGHGLICLYVSPGSSGTMPRFWLMVSPALARRTR